MTQREVGVEHDAIHAVIAAGQKIAIAFGELVKHRDTVVIYPHRDHRRPTLPRQGPSLPSAVSDGT
jgi:hypothetical protein